MADEQTAQTAEEAPAAEEVPAAETGGVEVAEAELPEAPPTPDTGRPGQVDVLLDVKLPVEVRLGQVDAQVRDLLQLGPGSVLQLDKPVGDPVELYLGGVPFATAQIVVVGDKLGVRIREILSQDSPIPADAAEQE
ncbi:MAG: FliM/FliN family flagellar motor switch protein [Planctomycetota bacterium]